MKHMSFINDLFSYFEMFIVVFIVVLHLTFKSEIIILNQCYHVKKSLLYLAEKHDIRSHLCLFSVFKMYTTYM